MPHEQKHPMTHRLKTHPDQFRGVWDGWKLHEVRLDDRGFAVGDFLRLVEWEPSCERFTGRWVLVHVSWKTAGGTWGLPDGLCVLSIVLEMKGDEGERPADA